MAGVFALNACNKTDQNGVTYELNLANFNEVVAYGEEVDLSRITIIVTENGEKHKSVFTAELTIDVAEPARSVTVIQMDKNDKEIKREGFSADKLPEEFTPDDNAAYLIVVSECDGDSYRKVVQPDEDTADVFIKLDELFCKKKKFDVCW